MLQLHGNPPQGTAPLANAEAPFNISTLTRFQTFMMKLLLADGGVLHGLAQQRTVEMDSRHASSSGW